MVISLESQNVKIKRTTNIGFKIPKIIKSLPKVKFNSRLLPYVTGIFFFSLIFSSGWDLFIPSYPLEANLDSVILPYHSADVVSKDKIASYDLTVLDKYYTVKEFVKGETLSTLAIKYGVSKDSILHINGITDVKKLDSMSELRIPISDGYIHKVGNRDTLEKISLKYTVPIKDIFRVNGLKSENIKNLESLFIPGIDPVAWGWRSDIYKYFVYPVKGYISKRYGFHTNNITGITTLYEGLDFVPVDDPSVYSSKGGIVSRIGYSANYGNYIYIDHQGGTRSLYAHLDKIKVSVRDQVSQGEVLGIVGKSGFTSEAKLFFSIFSNDESLDPEIYLK